MTTTQPPVPTTTSRWMAHVELQFDAPLEYTVDVQARLAPVARAHELTPRAAEQLLDAVGWRILDAYADCGFRDGRGAIEALLSGALEEAGLLDVYSDEWAPDAPRALRRNTVAEVRAVVRDLVSDLVNDPDRLIQAAEEREAAWDIAAPAADALTELFGGSGVCAGALCDALQESDDLGDALTDIPSAARCAGWNDPRAAAEDRVRDLLAPLGHAVPAQARQVVGLL